MFILLEEGTWASLSLSLCLFSHQHIGIWGGKSRELSLLTVFFQLKMADHAMDTTQPMEEILLCSVFRNEMEAVYMCIYVCIHICTERNRKPCWFFEQRDAKFVSVLPGKPQSAYLCQKFPSISSASSESKNRQMPELRLMWILLSRAPVNC